MKFPIVPALIVATLVAAPTFATQQPAGGGESKAFDVSVAVYNGDKMIMAPRLITRADEPATFMQRTPDQFFQLVARPNGKGMFTVTSNLVQWTPDGLIGDDATLEVSTSGNRETFTMQRPNAKTGAKGTLKVDVTITPISG